MSITFENVSKTGISYREKMSLKERKKEESEKAPHLFHDRLTTSLSGHVEGQQEASPYGRGCLGKKPNMSVSLSSGFRGINAKNGYEQSFRNNPYRNLSVSL